MNRHRIFIAIVAACASLAVAYGGHEQPVYPSYYPHEIEIAAVGPQEAGELLGKGKLHAYVGGAPSFAAAPPKDVASVPSLGAFVVVRLNPRSALARDEAAACGVVAAVVRELAAKGGDVIAHPYPVTPLHGDYLYHADLAEAAKARFSAAASGSTSPPGQVPAGSQPRSDSPPPMPEACLRHDGEGLGVGGTPNLEVLQSPPPCPSPTRGEGTLRQGPRADSSDRLLHGLKIRAEGALAQSLVRPEWRADGAEWDAAIHEVDAGRLVASATASVNGWMGPRWVRSGWFHAHRLLADSIADAEVRRSVDADLGRLQSGDVADPAERANLERDLVRRLTAGCRGAVAGYTVRREYFNVSFSDGIENIAFDALEGLNSPMFLRTVKLKDFPWNGWLKLGTAAPPAAAWNPIAGFTDDFGRLMWSAVGDPATIPSPNDDRWVLNRISEVEATPQR